MRHPYKSEETRQRALSNLTPGRPLPQTEETKAKIRIKMREYWKKKRQQRQSR